MSLLEFITPEEKKMIGGYIDNYASANGASRSASVDQILGEWDNQKGDLFRLLGNKLTISRTVEFKYSEEQLATELSSLFFTNPSARDFIDRMYNTICDIINTHRESWSASTSYYDLYDLTNYSNLAKNIYEGQTLEIKNPKNGKTIKAQSGCKITRLLGKIAEAYDVEGFEEFRIIHSQALNQKKLKGELVLSIHPFDYMTMSDNASGWGSCMSWSDYGEYRQGTVEMMNSPMVMVVYLKSSEDMRIGGFGAYPEKYFWNNKKWRTLFVINSTMISNIKSYPYRNDDLTLTALSWIRELAQENLGWNYTEKYCQYTAEKVFHADELNSDVCLFPETHLMYNDFLYNEDMFCYLSTGLPKGNTVNYNFNYSGASECMLCGELNPELSNEGLLAGECCEHNFCEYCDECGDGIEDEDDIYWVDGNRLCPYCFERYCAVDPLSEEYHYTSNMISIYLVKDLNHLTSTVNILVAPDSIADWALTKNDFKKLYKNIDGGYYFVTVEDCTLEGLRLFDLSSISEAEKVLDWFHTPYAEDDEIKYIEVNSLNELRFKYAYGPETNKIFYYNFI